MKFPDTTLMEQPEVGSELEFDARTIFQPARCSIAQSISPSAGTVNLLHSGRAALRSALRAIAGSAEGAMRFLLPAYLCSAILQPFRDLGVAFDFYPVDGQLGTDWESLRGEILSGRYTGLLYISYFGSTLCNAPPADLIADRRKFFLIEDRAQALLSTESGNPNHYIVYSLRKFFGLPDGGAVVTRQGCPPVRAASGLDGFFGLRLLAFRLRELYREEGVGTIQAYRQAFREAEKVLDASTKDFAMSAFSSQLFERQDLSAARRKRQKNFAFLRENWPAQNHVVPLALHWRLTDVPLGFPVVAQNRDAFQKALIDRRIYPPIHWNLPGEVPTSKRFQAAHDLSSHTLTIPCDQRYDRKEMGRVIATVREILR